MTAFLHMYKLMTTWSYSSVSYGNAFSAFLQFLMKENNRISARGARCVYPLC